MTFLDLFAGIGGFRRGMELAGHKCLGFCEWDKYARMSYISMHCITDKQRQYLATLDFKDRQKEILKDEYLNGEWCSTDIRSVDASNIPKADAWCFGAPCQDFSVAGRRAGLDGDRSSLVKEIFRILDEIRDEDKPEWLIYENVKGMLSSNKGLDYASILAEMDRGGYDIEWQLLNSKLHGVPQNRERVYTIGHLRSKGCKKVFPIKGSDGANSIQYQQAGERWGGKLFKQFPGEKFLSIKDAFVTDIGTDTASTVTARYYKGLGNHKDNMILEKADTSGINQIGHLGGKNRDNPSRYRVYGDDGIAPCMQTCGGVDANLMSPLKSGGTQIAHTLMARDYKGLGNQEMTGVLELINQSMVNQDVSQTPLQRERIGVSVHRKKREQR